MLYTGKGDNGTTKLFDCPAGVRLNKSELVFDVLGTLDELNSNLGYAKALSVNSKNSIFIEGQKVSFEDVLEKIQQHLFSIQAEVGGGEFRIKKEHTLYLERVIYEVDTIIPPIKSFIVSGGGETGAYLDVVRTIARRAERHLILLQTKKERSVNTESIAYLNRLSSCLYALARFANYQGGYSEKGPNYQ